MSILEYLKRHLPEDKAKRILAYLDERSCLLRITKPRISKRGDFRVNGKELSISVNHDENSFRFLFTFVHEIAHLETHLKFKKSVKPHGSEWKSNFRRLFVHFEVDEEFAKDEELYRTISKELENPSACSGVNVSVEKAFARYDDKEGTYLGDLENGQQFEFRGQVYEKLEVRRTRVLCLNMSNNRKYTINKGALITRC